MGIAVFALAFGVKAQNVLTNGTVDGPTGSSTAPYNWSVCGGSPDSQIISGTGNGIFGINTPPSDGTSYAGFVTTSSGYIERIGQAATLTAGTNYSGSVDLFRATSSSFSTWNGNGWMEIWGGSTSCQQNELLWSSPVITNVYAWQTFPISFTPTSNHTYITFQNTHNPSTPSGCYNCMDNIILSAGSVLAAFRSFTLLETGDGVQLAWETEPDHGFDHFRLEWSTDGLNFSSLGKMPAKSNQTGYTFMHPGHTSGLNHYRLQAIDANGGLAVSETRKILLDISNPTTVFPNPTNGATMLRFETAEQAPVLVQVFDNTGRKVLEDQGEFGAGLHNLDLDLDESLENGQYHLRLTIGDRVERHNIMIQK